eukprot:13453879-Alexandrium_andersonii.AAC.1
MSVRLRNVTSQREEGVASFSHRLSLACSWFARRRTMSSLALFIWRALTYCASTLRWQLNHTPTAPR